MVNKNFIYGAGVVAMIVVGIFFAMGSGAKATGNVASSGEIQNQGGVQKVVIGMKNYNYYPQEVRVKANQPVSISLDDSVYGCFRSFTIRELGLSKYLQKTTDTLDFTPTKKGNYVFSCSMGMGTGRFIVE